MQSSRLAERIMQSNPAAEVSYSRDCSTVAILRSLLLLTVGLLNISDNLRHPMAGKRACLATTSAVHNRRCAESALNFRHPKIQLSPYLIKSSCSVRGLELANNAATITFARVGAVRSCSTAHLHFSSSTNDPITFEMTGKPATRAQQPELRVSSA